ncbi:MAG: GNAT family N-acetyltransferase [Planctomycetota bacterium]
MDESKARLLRLVPDDGASVELRGLLRHRATRVVSGDDPGRGFALAPPYRIAAAFGRPGPAELERLVDETVALGLDPLAFELHAQTGDVERWDAEGLVETHPPALRFDWPDRASAQLVALVRHEVRALQDDDEALQTLPDGLIDELAAQEEFPACAASFAGGAVASLAYAFVETETLWDVSIETVSAFRREGFGASAAAFLIERQLQRGLRPVWSASTENAASLALAAKLGFELAGAIGVARIREGRARIRDER